MKLQQNTFSPLTPRFYKKVKSFSCAKFENVVTQHTNATEFAKLFTSKIKAMSRFAPPSPTSHTHDVQKVKYFLHATGPQPRNA